MNNNKNANQLDLDSQTPKFKF